MKATPLAAGWKAAFAVLVLGAILTIIAAHYRALSNQRAITQHVEQVGHAAVERLSQRLAAVHGMLEGVRGAVLMAGVERFDRPMLIQYVGSLTKPDYLTVLPDFGFVRRIHAGQLAAYLASLGGSIRLKELGPNAGERFIVHAHSGRNWQTITGLDIASEPRRRAAALQAMQSRAAAISAPVFLIGEPGRKASLLLLPVFSAPSGEVAGWVYAPLEIEAMLHGATAYADHVVLGLADGEPSATGIDTEITAPVATFPMAVFDRTWTLQLAAGEHFDDLHSSVSPLAVLQMGMLLTLALAALTAAIGSSWKRRHDVRTEQAKLVAVVESSADAIVSKDLNGRITSWNRGAERLFGYSAREALGRTVAELLVPAELQWEEQDILRQLANGQTVPEVETQRLHRDGRRIDVWVAVAPVRHPNGSIIGAAKTVRDITERKAAAARILADNARLEQVVAERTERLRELNLLLGSVLDAATGIGIIATNREGIITVFNRGAEAMLGYTAEELLQRHTPLVFHDLPEVETRARELGSGETDPVPPFAALVREAARCGAETREWTYIRKDGRRLTVSLIVTAMRDKQEELTGYLGVAVDVTQRHELLVSLEQAKEAAIEASISKSQFLANMSHEIRTPMNAVLGMLHLLRATSLNERQFDYVKKADGAARTLLRLLNDVLDYSKMEAGKLELEVAPFELEDLLEELGFILSGNQGNKPVELIFDIAPDVPSLLHGDRMRLQQILINLAGNALKFTERGHVKLSICILSVAGDNVRLRFSVADSGIGIAPEHQERVFTGFSQADASISRRFGGTGLGLVICQRLLLLMGSKLELCSMPGAGSDFWFDLSIMAEPCPSISVTGSGSALLISEHPLAAPVWQRMLVELGWSTRTVTATTAFRHLRTEPWDLIVLDASVAGDASIDLAHQIREDSSARVILLERNARALSEQEETWLAVLSKPVSKASLAAAISGQSGSVHQPSLPALRRLDGFRLLLVEDNELNRQVACELLGAEGATVTIAENGEEAVAQLSSGELPDAVLMDMQMPVMDGLEATRLLRLRHGLDLRIIAMTANASHEDRLRCIAAGMDDHLSKPIDIESLVSYLIGKDKKAEKANTPPCDATTLARFGGHADIYLKVIIDFEMKSGTMLTELARALNDEDWEQVRFRMHTLRGVLGTLGAGLITSQLAEMERSLSSGISQPLQNWLQNAAASDIAVAVSELKAELQNLLKQT